jgi:penicillin-binding protein 1A
MVQKRRPKKRRRPRRRRGQAGLIKKLFRLVKFTLFFLIMPIMLGTVLGGFLAFARTVPSIVELKQEVIPPGTKIFAEDDSLIGELKIRKGVFIPFELLPPDLINAVVSVEDSNYWKHGGIDYLAIVRAATADIIHRKIKQGASTITMQLAKNTFLTPERTFRRKFKELVLSLRIENNLTKEEILEFYLNRMYFGSGAYGVEMASQTYFGKPVKKLTLPEASMIAGLLKAPSAYSPRKSFKKAKSRQEIVLKRMENEGFISHKQRLKAQKTAIYLSHSEKNRWTNNYFVDYVRNYLEDRYGREVIYKGGLKVYTTLDKKAQTTAQLAVQKGILALDKRRGYRGPIDHLDLDELEEDPGLLPSYRATPPQEGDRTHAIVLEVTRGSARIKADALQGTLSLKDSWWAGQVINTSTRKHERIKDFNLKSILVPGDVIWVKVKSVKDGLASFSLEQEPEVQGALVALEPDSGYIRALIGGYNFGSSQYNRALYARRQVGSAFKPIIYALAMTRGFTPASIIVDEEINYQSGNEDEEYWAPRNYDGKYHGPTRLRVALAKSRNVVTVKLVDALGIDRLIDFAKRMGVPDEMPRNLTLALGSMGMTPLELTSTYGSFANGGLKMKPIGIKYITDINGRIIENNEPEGTRVLDRDSAFLITSMLQSAVKKGTGWRARALRRPVAGKTGTTNDNIDAWFLGYTPDLITGTWVGFDEPRFLGPIETGSRAAAPIWVDFMLKATANRERSEFDKPPTIVSRKIDPATGLLANKWTKSPLIEFFKEGTEPKKMAPSIWNIKDDSDILFDSDSSSGFFN